MNCSDGNYIVKENDLFKNMYYIEEEKRGFYPEENHIVSGVFEMKKNILHLLALLMK